MRNVFVIFAANLEYPKILNQIKDYDTKNCMLRSDARITAHHEQEDHPLLQLDPCTIYS